MLLKTVFALDCQRIPEVAKIWMIKATGEAGGVGWENPRLTFVNNVDGVVTFALEGDAPKLISIPQLNPLVASILYDPDPTVCVVRVISEMTILEQEATYITISADGRQLFDFPDYDPSDPDPMFIDDTDHHNDKFLKDQEFTKSNMICVEKTLLKIPIWVDVRVRSWKLQRKIKYKVTYLQYCYPGSLEQAVKDDIKKCLPVAAAAGVLAYPGGPAAVKAAFLTAFEACSYAELGKLLKIKVATRKTGLESFGASRNLPPKTLSAFAPRRESNPVPLPPNPP
jgi:hypothetical protein